MLRTIKAGREIDALFQSGTRAANRYVVALAGVTPEGRGPEGRVVFVAGRKMGNAVKRNRSKRVLRASVDRTNQAWPGHDVALIAKPETGALRPEELDQAIAEVLRRAGVTHA